MADAKRLAKNTLYMYARMILVMIVSIYTSRVILYKLGIDDYGLYNAVASIVAMVTFLNTTLSTSTSRFLTYDLGLGNMEKLKKTFSTSFYTHCLLVAIVVLLLETVGLWYMGNKFVIPEGRELAIHVIYQISIFTTAIAVIQVPFVATIMAHENMGVYAYLGIFDVFAKLGIVYLLSMSPIDHLIFYSILVAIVQLSVTLLYVIISRSRYQEVRLTGHFGRDTFKGMLGFTGWTAVANLSSTMIVQGSTILLNLFFAPAIIASKALANQVTSAVMQFVNNFRIALNPQIIKSYAAGNIGDFKKWSLRSTVITVDLLLVLGLPCLAIMKTLLSLWLVDVPELAVEFTQLAILTQIIISISSSTYIPFVASGKLKLNAIFGTCTGFGYFLVLFVLFKSGSCALWVQGLHIIFGVISVFVLRPYLLHRELGFTYKEVYQCFGCCFKTILISSIATYGLMITFGESLYQQILLFFSVFVVTCCVVWLTLERTIKEYLVCMLKAKIHK